MIKENISFAFLFIGLIFISASFNSSDFKILMVFFSIGSLFFVLFLIIYQIQKIKENKKYQPKHLYDNMVKIKIDDLVITEKKWTESSPLEIYPYNIPKNNDFNISVATKKMLIKNKKKLIIYASIDKMVLKKYFETKKETYLYYNNHNQSFYLDLNFIKEKNDFVIVLE